MKKKILITIGIILLAVIVIILLNPLRRSAETIKANILKLTPIGMDMEDVIKVVEKKRSWRIHIDYEYGFSKQESGTRRKIIGEKSISAFIGEYRNIFDTSVTVFWGFDENPKLIDVWVWKVIDGL